MDSKILNYTSLSIQSFSFVVYTALMAFVLVSNKFKFDKSAIITMAFYEISFLL